MRQPKNQNLMLDDLFYDIEEGYVKIPQFQRDFVWSRKDSARLLDSVVKGYPIGSFTLWETKEQLRSIRNIGGKQFPQTPKGYSIKYVLDGQQRITSLYASFHGLVIQRENKKEDFSKIYIDLTASEDEEIVITNITNREPEEVIKLQDVLGGGRKILDSYPEHLYEKIMEYKRRFNQYTFSTITLKDALIERATEVFERLNVGGKKLTSFEIMVAKTYDEHSGFDLSVKCEEFLHRVSQVGYGTLGESTILQVVSTLITKECDEKTILNLNKNEFISMWNPAVESMKRAIDYFRTYFHIPVSRLLPYNALLIPFSYFFHKHRNRPQGLKADLLQDFFWRVAIGERYSSSQNTRVSQDIRKIDKILVNEQPIYDYEVNVDPNHIIENGGFSTNRGFSKAILCLYAFFEPKSFLDNNKVVINNDWLKQSNSKNYHHFFPRNFLKGKVDERYANNVLNITIVDEHLNKAMIKDKPPSVYMTDFIRKNPSLHTTMKTHLINDLYDYGVFEDNYDKFILRRAAAVSRELEKRIIVKKHKSSIGSQQKITQQKGVSVTTQNKKFRYQPQLTPR